jgi:hypothetical protein
MDPSTYEHEMSIKIEGPMTSYPIDPWQTKKYDALSSASECIYRRAKNLISMEQDMDCLEEVLKKKLTKTERDLAKRELNEIAKILKQSWQKLGKLARKLQKV